jgi:predicted RNase H-like HicB family nuclease
VSITLTAHGDAYKVVLILSDEGYVVSCPALPACHAQGATEYEAFANLGDVIRAWLATQEVTISYCLVRDPRGDLWVVLRDQDGQRESY